jgi:hypothetical protein
MLSLALATPSDTVGTLPIHTGAAYEEAKEAEE